MLFKTFVLFGAGEYLVMLALQEQHNDFTKCLIYGKNKKQHIGLEQNEGE